MDFETSLQVLGVLSDVLTVPHTLDESLDRIAEMTGTLLETEQTVLLLRDEDRHELVVRTRVGIEASGLRVGHPLEVPERLMSILWRVRRLRQINWVDSGIEHIGFPILVVPLRVKGERIGMLITGRSLVATKGFDSVRRKLFVLVASFASVVIENAKVYDYLRQRFAHKSQELIEENRRDAAARDETEQLMISSLRNPNKVVRLLAESFYKELTRAGFGPGHVTTAAAHLLECITRGEFTGC